MPPVTQFVYSNGLRIAYETFGDPADPPVLLVAGLAIQMLAWPDELCEKLAGRGYYVVRADNRDIGLSAHFTQLPALTTTDILRGRAQYAINDLADDTAGLIAALGLRPVHLVGASMGGFIAQTVAIHYPERVRTQTLIMTSTGSKRVGWPRWDVAWQIARRPPSLTRDAAITAAIDTFTRIGSPAYPVEVDLIRDIAGRSFDRDTDASGRLRQLAAVYAQPDRTKQLAKLAVPTLVLHGLADPVVNASGGLAIARAVPGARFVGFSGMGHNLPTPLWPTVLDELTRLAK
jgi:pimeloyl-ACP methyl ester carboxylesterase